MEQKITNNANKGFTIVEVLISLTIFSIAVAGVITVAVQGSLNVNAARNKVTASYLADEGVELMRSMRDTAVVNAGVGFEAAGWTAFNSPAFASLCITASCDIDPTNNAGSDPYPSASNISDCTPTAGFCHLYYVPSTGYYTGVVTTPGLTPSIFSRGIRLTVLNPDEIQITSTVQWTEGTVVQSVTQTETLFNWYI